MPDQLSGLLFHATDTPSCLPRSAKISTGSKHYSDYFPWLSRHSVLLSTPFLAQSIRLALLLIHHCEAPVLLTKRYVTPWSPGASHLTIIWETEDFREGAKYFKHVSLLTYLIYFSPKILYMVGPIYVLGSTNRTFINLSLVMNQCFKSPIS